MANIPLQTLKFPDIDDIYTIPQKTSDLTNDAGFQTEAQVNTKLNNYVANNTKGAANGVCPLNSASVIDGRFLPSYVDSIVEVYARAGQTPLSSTWLATGSATGPVVVPATNKVYVLMQASGGFAQYSQYRWSGSIYVAIASGTGISYADLSGKPSIEGVTLAGDKTFDDLGLVPISNAELLAILV